MILRSPAAESDLTDIWLWIAADNVPAADRMLDRIAERINQLQDFPNLGPSRPDIGDGARSLTVGNYLVLYRISGDDIVIVRVVQGNRDLTTLL